MFLPLPRLRTLWFLLLGPLRPLFRMGTPRADSFGSSSWSGDLRDIRVEEFFRVC